MVDMSTNTNYFDNGDPFIGENSKMINSDRWLELFNSDIFYTYKSSEIYSSYMLFNYDEFFSLFLGRSMCLDQLEYLTKARIYNIIFRRREFFPIQTNYCQILFETEMFFKKIHILTADNVINNLLYKTHGSNYPNYHILKSPIDSILNDKTPLSYDSSYVRKNNAKDLYRNLDYLQNQIKGFNQV